MNEEEFVEVLKAHGLPTNEQMIRQFKLYFEMLIEWNQKMNLTAITDQEEVYLKHFYDSLLPAMSFFDFNQVISLCDVGAGAGFPSIPLKILFPHLQVTIIDSLNKRIHFLEELAQTLELKDCQFLHGRAEDWGQDKAVRQSFDLVTARAVAALNVLCEFCLPFAKKSGYFLVLKGGHEQTQTELKEASKAISTLGGKLVKEDYLLLPKEESERSLLLIQKCLETPKKYPRKAGTPAKKPL